MQKSKANGEAWANLDQETDPRSKQVNLYVSGPSQTSVNGSLANLTRQKLEVWPKLELEPGVKPGPKV